MAVSIVVGMGPVTFSDELPPVCRLLGLGRERPPGSLVVPVSNLFLTPRGGVLVRPWGAWGLGSAPVECLGLWRSWHGGKPPVRPRAEGAPPAPPRAAGGSAVEESAS